MYIYLVLGFFILKKLNFSKRYNEIKKLKGMNYIFKGSKN